MIVTVEISHYPLKDEYEEDIIEFIKKINSHSKIQVHTNSMSTYIKGEWKNINAIISEALESIWLKGSTSSTIMKIIPRNLPVEAGYYDL